MSTLRWSINPLSLIRFAEDDKQESARTEAASIAIDARIRVYPMGDDHPLISSFGVFENDPIWAELFQIIDDDRKDNRDL